MEKFFRPVNLFLSGKSIPSGKFIPESCKIVPFLKKKYSKIIFE
jgi:hypothetical protein